MYLLTLTITLVHIYTYTTITLTLSPSHITLINLLYIPYSNKKLDAKAKKCILVGYLHEHKGYKCYKPQTKKVWVSRDVIFDKSTSWYSLPPSTPETSEPNSEDEASLMVEEEIGSQEESLIPFRLSGPFEG